jgi:tRNA threonylcarbamoyladenosine biosynthesis protein TsaB
VRILALETVTRAGSLAVYSSDGPGPAVLGDDARTHGVRLPGELLDFVQAAGFTLPDIDAFAVVTGPGSFTGLRIGLATIQGLALAGGRPAIGIPTLEAMAGGWIDASAGEATRLGVWLDAARGDVFYAAYDVDAGATLETARILWTHR